MSELADIVKKSFGVNEPLLVEDILALNPGISRQAVYKKIGAAVETGGLARYGRGVYYVPEETRFGNSEPSAMALVQRKWLKDEGGTCGYVTGPALANDAGITDQVPAVLDVATNRESTRVRDVASFGGWRRIRLRRPRTTVTSDNVDALRFLDLITAEPIAQLSDEAVSALRTLACKAERDKVYEYASLYPAKTSKRLIECEAKDVFA